jgi:hypothetical protein
MKSVPVAWDFHVGKFRAKAQSAQREIRGGRGIYFHPIDSHAGPYLEAASRFLRFHATGYGPALQSISLQTNDTAELCSGVSFILRDLGAFARKNEKCSFGLGYLCRYISRQGAMRARGIQRAKMKIHSPYWFFATLASLRETSFRKGYGLDE